MHAFYRNRLVRAYLGASRKRAHRRPDAFTGFDEKDDIPLARFNHEDKSITSDGETDCQHSYVGPYPIINTAMNISVGADLGIQERKAESFVFTPLWSGFDFARRQFVSAERCMAEFAFRRTDRFAVSTVKQANLYSSPGKPETSSDKPAAPADKPADSGETRERSMLLGSAMAISGAAFNSNAGFHTSPGLAFLLTTFGVRMGWWAGNPRGKSWEKPSPEFALSCLYRELTAHTKDSSDFVLLSDGGHFENMGLYELIRRRCRYIVLSDAEEDEEFKLEGIGGAIRKCRDDFGVVINLDIKALEPLGDPAESKLHYSLGTIVYPGQAECGHLVYIKASVTGDEPVDVIEFRKRHAEFPHTSTVNQFFDESHFESYRALGHHAAHTVFTMDMPSLPLRPGRSVPRDLERLFTRIEGDFAKRREWLSSAGKGAEKEKSS
jgi:hypothetical protein